MLNEERGLEPLVARLRPVLESLGLDWEVVFVDDGSTDGTLAKLKALHAQDRRAQGDLAQPQLRQGDRHRGAASTLCERRCGRADGRRPAASARADRAISSSAGARASTSSTGSGIDRDADSFLHRLAARAFYVAVPEAERHQRCPRAPATFACSTARRSMP